MKLRNLPGLLVAVAVLVGAIWLIKPDAQRMPDVTFNLVDGGTLDSDLLRGESLVVNFWSVSCEVCLRDMPRLRAMHESLADQGVRVIGVAMPHDPPPAVVATVERLQPGYPIALDVHGELVAAFGDVAVTPTLFLVDPQGNIRYSAHGPLDETRVRASLLTF